MPSYIKHEIDVELKHSFEFLLELCHMLAVGDLEVVIGITALIDCIRRSGSADSEDRSGAICPLSLPECLQIRHQSSSHNVFLVLVLAPHLAATDGTTNFNGMNA